MAALVRPELAADWLREAVEWPSNTRVTGVRLNRLWAGRHGRISFEFALSLKAHGAGATYMLQGRSGVEVEPHREHRVASIESGRLAGIRVASRELGIACWTADKDRKLPVLRQLLDEPRLRETLSGTTAGELLGSGGVGEPSSPGLVSRIVAYRASRRCVLSVTAAGGGESGAFVKAFRRPPSAEQVNTVRQVGRRLEENSEGRVRAPEITDYLPEKGLVITRAITGSAEGVGSSPADLHITARAMHALHCVTPSDLAQRHTVRDEFQTACRWVSVLRRLRKPEFGALRTLVTRLADVMQPARGDEQTLIHRDFYGAQLRRTNDVVWLTDFDTLAVGNREIDVSTYVAHIFLDCGVIAGSWRRAEDTAAAFLDEYKGLGGTVRDAQLRFHLSCAMARLGAVHLVRGLAPDAIQALWHRASEYAAGKASLT